MELICNELSYYPLADSNQEAERRFKLLFETFKKANDKYGFKRIKFHSDYFNQQVTTEYRFGEWISSVSNSTLKNIILTFFRKPFADDNLEDKELEVLLGSKYELTREGSPANQDPLGLPIAYIQSIPALSFDSHAFWHNRKIDILKTNESDDGSAEDFKFQVYNICLPSDIEEEEMSEWANKQMSINVDSEEMLIKYLAYEKYSISFGGCFLSQLFEWRSEKMDVFKYILLLMKDVQLHPFAGGMGQTENLKYRGKEASKRITSEHRLSYELTKDVVTFMACKGHYDFH